MGHTPYFRPIFGRPFVKRFALCYQTVVCPVCSVLSVLSVTLVYCGQTVGRIKIQLGMQVGLGPGHIVLDGDPAPPTFDPYLLRPNGCRDQDATWYGGRPRPRRHCVRWGPSSPLTKKGQSPYLQFSAHVQCSQTAGWIKMPLGTEVGLSPARPYCVIWGPKLPPPKKRGHSSPHFSAHIYCGQTAG